VRRFPNGHPDEELLEGYAMGTLRGAGLARLEEHLLICEECQDRLREVDAFVSAIREAAAHLMGVVTITHATEDGPVRLEAQQHGRRRWNARFEGPQLEGGDTFTSFQAAFHFLELSFSEMYPKHRCTEACCRGN